MHFPFLHLPLSLQIAPSLMCVSKGHSGEYPVQYSGTSQKESAAGRHIVVFGKKLLSMGHSTEYPSQ